MVTAPTYLSQENQSQTLAQAPCPHVDMDRKRAMKEAWSAYRGDFRKPLKVRDSQPDDNVISNRCAPIVDKGVSFLFGQVLKIECTDETSEPDTVKQEYLNGVWGDDDDRMTLLAQMAINGGVCGECVPFGEVLTPQGWRDIRDFEVGDPVFTVEADGTLKETVVAQVHQHHYQGDMISVNVGNLRMVCTPDHSIAKMGGTRLDPGKLFSLVPFNQLPAKAHIMRAVKWEGTPLPDFSPEIYPTRKRKLDQPATLSSWDFLEFLGWFLSEGNTEDTHKLVCITQHKVDQRIKIRALLDRCRFHYSETPKAFMFTAPDWWAYLRQFGKCAEKFVPEWVKNGTREELQILFNALMAGDGHWRKKEKGVAGDYYTLSRRLADDVAEIALKLGYIVNVTQRERKERNSRGKISYQVRFTLRESGHSEILTDQHIYDTSGTWKRKSDIQHIPFSGQVYDIGIADTHTFIIRQHGSVWVSGNCFVKIIPAQDGMKYPRLVVMDPLLIRIVTLPDDCSLHLAYIIEYPAANDLQKRQIIARVDANRNLALLGNEDILDTWTISNYVRRSGGNTWMQIGEEEVWPYPFPPIFTNQNLPNPNEAWGIPDLTPDLINQNKVLNFIQSNTSRIIKFHGHPKTYATGLSAQQINIGVDDLICLPSPDSKLSNLEMQSDLASSLNFASVIRSDMDEQSRVPAVALGRLMDMPHGDVSGIALALMFQPLLEKTTQKRRLYGRLIRDISRAALVLGGLLSLEEYEEYPINLHWQDLLPTDKLKEVQAAILLKNLGVSDYTLQSSLGFDPEEEAEKSQMEDARKMEAYARGQAMMPEPVLPPKQPTREQEDEDAQ